MSSVESARQFTKKNEGDGAMANILILNGASRKNGNTAMLIKAFTEGAVSAGNRIKEFYLQDMDIHGCFGCEGCSRAGKNADDPCVQKDDMSEINKAFVESEVVVLASPVYFWTISGTLKVAIENAELYHFGCLTSNIHNAWSRLVAGRLKSDYSYSPAVYNNFPWPTPTDAQKAKIEQTAQAILDTRSLYPDASLADLYDEVAMPPELRRAHQDNDRAVMQAYGFSVKEMTESKCVAELMKMYQRLIEGK